MLVGGAARATDARVVSKHSTWELAHARAGQERDSGRNPGAYVEHADTYEAACTGGSVAVQALAGKVRS